MTEGNRKDIRCEGRGKEGKGRERGRGEHITCWLCVALLQLPTVVFNISKCVFLGKQCLRSHNQSRRHVLDQQFTSSEI